MNWSVWLVQAWRSTLIHSFTSFSISPVCWVLCLSLWVRGYKPHADNVQCPAWLSTRHWTGQPASGYPQQRDAHQHHDVRLDRQSWRAPLFPQWVSKLSPFNLFTSITSFLSSLLCEGFTDLSYLSTKALMLYESAVFTSISFLLGVLGLNVILLWQLLSKPL